MIKKVNEAWKRLLSNDYAYFLIFPIAVCNHFHSGQYIVFETWLV